MSAQQFMEMLFGKLPEFFKDEAELRALWSAPDTRKALLRGAGRKGLRPRPAWPKCRGSSMPRTATSSTCWPMWPIRSSPLSREERAAEAKIAISTHFNTKQQVFLDFVLSHYVQVGVDELDQEKLTPLLKLKYHNRIADAVADLGSTGRDQQSVHGLPALFVHRAGSLNCHLKIPISENMKIAIIQLSDIHIRSASDIANQYLPNISRDLPRDFMSKCGGCSHRPMRRFSVFWYVRRI